MPEKEDWTREELEKEYINTMTAVTIPVNIHIRGQQRVLDLSEMKKILKEAELISLGECGCRKQLKNCEAPLDVCFGLDKKAKDLIKKKLAKKTSLEVALEALERSHKMGLVHISYTFEGDEKPEYVCSCCSCCCHSMSALVRFGMPNAVVKSKYISANNVETCTDCGTCVERCQFRARQMEDGKMTFNQARCFGCGLCVSACPTGSISMVRRVS